MDGGTPDSVNELQSGEVVGISLSTVDFRGGTQICMKQWKARSRFWDDW